MTGALFLVTITAALGASVAAVLRRFDRLRLWPAALLILAAPLEVYRTNLGPFNLSVFRIALGVTLLLVLTRALRRPPRGVAVPIPFVLYGMLLLVQAVSVVLVTTEPELGLKLFSQYLAGLTAAAVVVITLREDDVGVAMLLLLAAAVIPAVASVWRVLGFTGSEARTLPGLSLLPVGETIAAGRESGSFLLDGVQRMQGTFGDPNHFAFFIVAVVVAAVAWFVATSIERPVDRRRLLLFALIAAAGAALIVASYSRSAWLYLAVAVALFIGLAGAPVRRLLARPAVATGTALLVLAFTAVTAPAVAERLDFSGPGNQLSADVHFDTMGWAIDLLVANPALGVGLGAYGSHVGQPELVSSAHSTLLTTGAEVGLPGLLLLLATMVATTWWGAVATLRATTPHERVMRAALTSAYCGIVVANVLYEIWLDDFQWMLFGLLVAATAPPAWRPQLHLTSGLAVTARPRGRTTEP